MPSYIKVYNIKVKYIFLKYFLNDFNLQWAIFALKMQFLPEVKELKEVKIWVSWTQQVIELNSNMFQFPSLVKVELILNPEHIRMLTLIGAFYSVMSHKSKGII